jgi:Spy/CpxP family protein refolding chaperone
MIGVGASAVWTMISGLYALISTTLTAIGVVGALNVALATLLTLASLGLAVVVGYAVMDEMSGPPPDGGGAGGFSGYGGGGGGGGATVNIYGDVGQSQYQKMKDSFADQHGEQTRINEKARK